MEQASSSCEELANIVRFFTIFRRRPRRRRPSVRLAWYFFYVQLVD